MIHNIIYKDIELHVEGQYIKGEEAIFYDNNGGHPGYAERFEIDYVYIGQVDIFELLDDSQLSDIEEIILKEY